MTNKTNLKNMNKGITLIALVITIIVLLILAGISIATLTGQNGVLTKASIAQEESKKAEYKEILELIGNGIKPEKTLEQLDTKTFMDRYEEKIREKIKKGEALEGATIERTSDSIIRVTTKEGYVYKVTENEVTYLGKYGENTPPTLQESDIDFNLNPSEYTTENIEVEIVVKINMEGSTLQYSTDGTNWTNYVEKVIFSENGTIHARLINEIGETGGVASKEIDIIDRENPQEAIVDFSSTSTDTENSITATVTQTDKGASGVDFTNSKWKYSTESGTIGTNPSSYTGGSFSKSPEDIPLTTTTPGTYYLHVLTIDKAGNPRETIKGPITVTKAMAKVGVIVTGENKEYTKNGTAKVPVGFAIKPGCDDVSNGLVISDVANDIEDTGNQFVWVPVTSSSAYVRNFGYPHADTTLQGVYNDSGYLPSGITNESQTVLDAGGFYIARYETGSGLVSKKGIAVWNMINYESAKDQSKKFVNNTHVKSALISGVQWDVTMAFVNGKKDGSGNTFNVSVHGSHRFRENRTASGQNISDQVCNIYDLQGNYLEYTAERANCGTWPGNGSGIYRGGKASSVGWASDRYPCSVETYDGSFRMVLYVL